MLPPITLHELELTVKSQAHRRLRTLASRIRDNPRDVPATLRAPLDYRAFAALSEPERFSVVKRRLRLQVFDSYARVYPILAEASRAEPNGEPLV